MLTARIVNLRSCWACLSAVCDVEAGFVGDGGTVVTKEMLVMVMTWPSESEVVAVSVIVLVLARAEVEDVVDDVVAEEGSGSIEKNVSVESSEKELVSSVND
jgi:hypothetical protein